MTTAADESVSQELKALLDGMTELKNGDFNVRLPRDWDGVAGRIATVFNELVAQNRAIAGEWERLSREVGKEGRIQQRANIRDLNGSWAGMVTSVNTLVEELVGPTIEISRVMVAVANGDLSTKITTDVRGEFLQLKEKVNTMVDQLRFFTSEVTRVAREVGVEGKLGQQAIATGAAGTWKELTDNVNQLAANLTTQVRAIAEVAISVTRGDLTRSISMDVRGEVKALKDTLNQMITNLRITAQKDADQVWLKSNLARFTLMLQGQTDLQTVSAAILSELSKVVGSQHGVFYIADIQKDQQIRLRMLSAFAYQPRQDLTRDFALGEGLVGQCARDKQRILISNPPADYIKISSGLGEDKPANIVVLPILFEGQLKAVLELASFNRFTPTHLDFLEQLIEGVGIVLNTLEANLHTEALLKSLQTQQEELHKTNQALEDKADQLALTSKYKSEFLSNMSHELRTPLNSMMILSQQLAEDTQNLSPKQVEYARTIHASGGDLLSLINDILDLSKVESGTLALELSDLPFSVLRKHIERMFHHVAENKSLQFTVQIDPSASGHIRTDGKRLEQILRNLLSNAFKFTDKGQVTLKVGPASGGWSTDHPVLSKASAVIAFTVTDTGIGIHHDKQKIIFEAFQQADSGTGRKYGGTGLGLSISRELARLLGCQLTLASSSLGRGSSFVLYAPSDLRAQPGAAALEKAAPASSPPSRLLDEPMEMSFKAEDAVADDRDRIQPGDEVLMIVEDNRDFAGIILDAVRQKGFKGVVAHDGRSAVKLTEQIKPDAITLDIRLPDIDGWGVLARFKNDPDMRHIPVQIISVDEDHFRGIKQGALAMLSKPVGREDLTQALDALRAFRARPVKNLLLLCADKARGKVLSALLGGDDVQLTLVMSGQAALKAIESAHHDCIVLEMPEKESLVVLKAIGKDSPLVNMSILVIHLKSELDSADQALLSQAAQHTMIKEVHSLERLLDESALYLHRALAGMSLDKRRLIEDLYLNGVVITGKKALVVDDDFRNIFAMTGLLENNHMVVHSAESGALALRCLNEHPDIDLVLMDIMMPDMDGYQAMQAIRRDPRFAELPIIALTAKAMKGDREKCVASGASDYITKPVDSQLLLGMMRLWLHR